MHSLAITKKKWFLMGVITGVILSLFVMPFIEDCHQLNVEPLSNDNIASHNWYEMVVNSDFRPVVHLIPNQSRPLIDSNHISSPKVFRHKYYATELNIKEKLLICVQLSGDNRNAFNSYLLNETIRQLADKVMVFDTNSRTTVTPKDIDFGDSIIQLYTESTEVPLIRHKAKNKYFNSYQLNDDSSDDQLIPNLLNFTIIYSSVTIYPVISMDTYYRLQLILCQKSINKTTEKLESIERQIITSNDNRSVEWPVGVVMALKPTNRFDVNRWLYFNESHSLMPNDFDISLPLNAIESLEMSQIKLHCIEWIENKYNILMNEDNYQIINIYKKFDAIRGTEYLVDFSLTAFPNIKRLQIIKPFNKIELISDVPYVTESVRIVLILVVKSREEIDLTLDFLNQYSNTCLKKSSHRTVLIIVLMYRNDYTIDDYLQIKGEAQQLQYKYNNFGAKIVSIPIRSAKVDRVATEIAYLDLIVKKLTQTFMEALVVHCRPNMILSLDYLNRIRLNTIQSNQVFFPIPFVEYRLRSQVKPLKNFDVRKDKGFFETTNYNHFSFYLSDYIKARKLSQRLLPIVRNEQFLKRDIYYSSDIDVFNLFVNYNKQFDKNTNDFINSLFIMRAIEPELRLKHKSYTHDCLYYESNTNAIENCVNRSVIGLGTKSQLAALVIDDNKKEAQEVNDNDDNINIFR
ncbi:chondroitin sulfate synthase 2-like [Oppia nitens]|uniref:chondroitin sulfate synthase 2-like n=1 Tax=Oppia nitens TaxID=1686743 RepID=UPI0023DCE8EF|nr:chondroitin sulfate synthase 2-like [Oppia nitens]